MAFPSPFCASETNLNGLSNSSWCDRLKSFKKSDHVSSVPAGAIANANVTLQFFPLGAAAIMAIEDFGSTGAEKPGGPNDASVY